jgi:hypothetical protein
MRPTPVSEARLRLKAAIVADLTKEPRDTYMDLAIKYGLSLATIFVYAKEARVRVKDVKAATNSNHGVTA